MKPPMSWARTWRIIKHVRVYGLPKTPGQLKYLYSEIERMSHDQQRRLYTECSGIPAGGQRV